MVKALYDDPGLAVGLNVYARGPRRVLLRRTMVKGMEGTIGICDQGRDETLASVRRGCSCASALHRRSASQVEFESTGTLSRAEALTHRGGGMAGR